MGKINLSIVATTSEGYGCIVIDYLATDNVTSVGTDYYWLHHIARLRDEKDGWRINRVEQTEFDIKIKYADIVLFNQYPVHALGEEIAQGDITEALYDAIQIK